VDLRQELQKRADEITALRHRLEDTENARQSLEARTLAAEGLAAAVRQAVNRLETFLALEVQRRPTQTEGLEAAVVSLQGHLGPILADDAALAAGTVLEAAALPCRWTARSVPVVRRRCCLWELARVCIG
jgi:hypothetical protein